MLTLEKPEGLAVDIPKEVFSEGLLDKVHHERLLADLPKVAEMAGIPPQFVWSKLSEYCKGEDYQWVRHIRSLPSQGLCYTAKQAVPVEDKMMAITGALLRNYIDARVLSLQEVIARLKDGDMPSPTVLLIPNFCLDKSEGGDIPSWQVSSLLGLLITRMSQNLKTVLYVSSIATLEKSYGEVFKQHITTHFEMV